MSHKSESSTVVTYRRVAVLTKDWTYRDVMHGNEEVHVPSGTEYPIGEYNNTDFLPSGDMRWFYWVIPQDHFKLHFEEVTTTTTVTTKRTNSL